MSGQGISSADFTALETAKTADISGYINQADTPPPVIDISVLPQNLITKVQECDGNDNCKLVSYDFIADTGVKASSSPYLIQLESTSGSADKLDVAVLAKVGNNPVTSLGIPTENLTSQYNSGRLQLTPPIASGPIGYNPLDSGYAISGTGTPVTAASADACATECNATDCQGFNFDESATQCKLFILVDKEAIVKDLVGGNSNKIKTLTITLKDPITGLAVGQKVEGLSSYINDDTLKITNVTSSTQIQLGFSEQIVKAIPANTPIRIKAPTDVSALQAYASEKDHINVIGVNGSETYGYNAIFKILQITGLPTVTNGNVPAAVNAIAELNVPVNMAGINAVISTGVLPINKSGSTCNSGVYSTNEVQTTACTCNDASVANTLCKIPMNVKTYTTTNITFQLPSNSTLPNGSASGSPLNLSAIEFTATLAAGSEVPSDRIIGWAGSIAQTSGSIIPVTVKSYTSTTITFTFTAQSYTTINAQDVLLSDTKGRSCQDIKACNASIQRLLDAPSVRSFSTNDLVACSGCNERAYKIPVAGSLNISNLRKYLWFENAGPYECTTVAPAGTVLDDKCNITCPTRTDGGTTSYDSATATCRVTCRTGFYWNGTTCVTCPTVTLPPNIAIQLAPMCLGTCVHASGTTPTNMLFTPTVGTDITSIPNYVKACVVSCSTGLPNPSNIRCCPIPSGLLAGTTITSFTNDDCSTYQVTCAAGTTLANPSSTRCCSTTPAGLLAGTTITSFTNDDCSTYQVTCAGGPIANAANTRCCPTISPPTGTTITGYTDNCVTPVCGKTDGTNDFINTVSPAVGPTCSYACLGVTTNNGTTSVVNTSDATQSGLVLPAKYSGSTFTALTASDTELVGAGDVQTNIGTYVFSPALSRAAIYTGTGTPSLYNLPSGGGVLTIKFPFKIKIDSIQFWKTGVTSVDINLKSVQGATTSVFSQAFALSSTPLTFNNTQTTGFGRFLTLTFTGSGPCTVAYKITATVQKICTAVCIYTGSNGRPFLDERTCGILCDPGFSSSAGGCSSCPSVNLDPGTNVIFNSGDCGGQCLVFDPTVSTSQNSLTGADAYAGTSTGSTTFLAAATGTSRACHINACPSTRTKYTNDTNTTLNNSGCCPIPTITDSGGNSLVGTGITWSYTSGSVAATTSPGTCTVSCTLPGTNTYGMSVSPSGSSCVRGTCPTLAAPAGFTITRLSTCEPVCALSTADTNAGTPTATYASGSSPTVSCMKTCLANFSKDNSTTANDTSPCCSTHKGGDNITITYGTTTCNSNPCSVTNNDSTYASISRTSTTCTITCKTRGTDQDGTTGSYSADGKCTFSCSRPNQTTYPQGTGNPASNGSNQPYCAFECSGTYYKPTSVSLCCLNITVDTNTQVGSKNTGDCGFSCSIKNTTTHPSTTHTAVKDTTNRTCALGCVPVTPDSYTQVASAATTAGGCTNFTCSIINTATYPTTTYAAVKDATARTCALGCAAVTPDSYTQVASGPTTVGSCTNFTCSIINTATHPSTTHTAVKDTTNRTCALGCATVNTDSYTQVASAATTAGSCTNFTCSIINTTTYPSTTYTAVKDATARTCSLGCQSGYYMRGTTCCKTPTLAAGTSSTPDTNGCGFSCSLTSDYSAAGVYTATKIDSGVNRSCTLSCISDYIQYPGSGSDKCCKPGYFPYNGVCTIFYKAPEIDNLVNPFATYGLYWCWDVKGTTTITEAWWNVSSWNGSLKASIPATQMNSGGCPSGGQYSAAAVNGNTRHVKCSPGYSLDLDNLMGTGNQPDCYLSLYLSWVKGRGTVSCSTPSTSITCNGQTYATDTRISYYGLCLSTYTTCTPSNYSCPAGAAKWGIPSMFSKGVCSSL